MNNPVLTGAILIEANGAALNAAGRDEDSGFDNATAVKQIRVGRLSYPYISGQAWRRWWREVLYEDFNWKPSPVTRAASSAYTEGQPISYEDDDVFGYMAAKKASKKDSAKKKDTTAKEKTDMASLDVLDEDDPLKEAGDEKGTQRRTSPLKNSLLISVRPLQITRDSAYFTRGLPVDTPNPVPYNTQHYTTCLQGVFTLGLNQVGRFECGPMRDLAINFSDEHAKEIQAAESNLKPRVLGLDPAQKRKRVAQTLKALGQLRHGANLARNLSDVTPAVVLLGFLHGGNAPFQNLFTPAEDDRVELHWERLESVVRDYKDRLLGEDKLYFGYRPGVLANEADILKKLKNGVEGVEVFIGTPREAIEEAAKVVENQTDSPIQ